MQIAATQTALQIHMTGKPCVRNPKMAFAMSVSDSDITLNLKRKHSRRFLKKALEHEVLHLQLDHHLRFMIVLGQYITRYGLVRYNSRRATAHELYDEAFALYAIAADAEVNHRLHYPEEFEAAVRIDGAKSYQVEDLFWDLARKAHERLRVSRSTMSIVDVATHLLESGRKGKSPTVAGKRMKRKARRS